MTPEGLRASKPNVTERFWSSVGWIGRSESDCWIWAGERNKTGYGRFYLGPKETSVRAHRYAYACTYGAIPNGMQVLHRCDVRACVRPSHLFLGTHQDNMDDMNAKGRGVKGEAVGSALLTADQERAILASRESHGKLARKYGVAKPTIQSVRDGRSWRHIREEMSRESE